MDADEALRRGLEGLEWTHGRLPVLILLGTDSSANEGSPTATFDQLDAVASSMRDFFLENSDGKLDFDFYIPRTTVSSGFSAEMCNDGSRQCPGIANAYNWANELEREGKLPRPANDYVRVVLFFQSGCSCLPLGGAALQGRGVAIGTTAFNNNIGTILAHELGHTLGAEHAGFNDNAYGNSFAIMGNSGPFPATHFLVAGKLAFRWLDAATQIHTFARPNHPECEPMDGGNCLRSGTVWIDAHDEGSYRSDRQYGIRIFTGVPGAPFWLEYRYKYRSRNKAEGAIMYTAPHRPSFTNDIQGTVEVYGPTNLVEKQMGGVSEAVLNLGESFVYDLDGTGVRVTPLAHSNDNRRLSVRVEFLPRTFEADYDSMAGSNVDGALTCSSSKRMRLSRKGDVSLYRLQVDQPSQVQLKQLACSVGGSSSTLATSYLYPAYPTHLSSSGGDGSFEFNAIKKFSVICNGKSQTTSLSFNNLYSLGKDKHLPMPEAYYLALVTDSKPSDAILNSVFFQTSCGAPTACRDNFYFTNGECVQCPLGKRAPTGATKSSECYTFYDSFTITSSTHPEVNGRYKRTSYVSLNAFAFVRQGSDPLYLTQSHVYWAFVSPSNPSERIAVLPSVGRDDPHPMLKGNKLESAQGAFVFSDGEVDSAASAADAYRNHRELGRWTTAQEFSRRSALAPPVSSAPAGRAAVAAPLVLALSLLAARGS
mmetsp:Transcript_15479/g.49385  ORF Transcript_15479/g.49385 Transcript_15479/m.49385 type:complete len:707 (+) Transcript_15479:1-2121(+)